MLVIGLISGTSVDGIDAALVEVEGIKDDDLKIHLIRGQTYPYPAQLREQILGLCAGEKLSLEELVNLDDAIAQEFARAAQEIEQGEFAELIGSHGQTLFHRPTGLEQLGYSLQLGRGEVIAAQTQKPTVNQFRQADIAAGGHGAPLVCKVDAMLLSHQEYSRCIQNIGGIGNLTYLPPKCNPHWKQEVVGWDTGPGNVLLDLAVLKLTNGQQKYDQDGYWASQGVPCQELVGQWLENDFFKKVPPKSTGRELFGLDYLKQCQLEAEQYQLSDADWLATLTELTVESIVISYRRFLSEIPQQVFLCGGGSRNLYLKSRLQAKLAQDSQVMTTDEIGLSADYKEAIAFAVLAYWRLINEPGNLPQVTGAKAPMLLGQIHIPVYGFRIQPSSFAR